MGQSVPTVPIPLAPAATGTIWGTGWGNAWKSKMDYSNDSLILAARFGVKADGVTSDDVALAAAITYCGTKKGKLIVPGGNILLTGASSTTATIQNCLLQGNGIFGTNILLTSTSVKPFILKKNWGLEGITFYHPNQTTGSTSYPPIFNDNGVDNVSLGYINNVVIVNAYDGFKATNGIDWSNVNISDSSMWAVHDLLTLNSTGDSWRLTNTHFTHGPWVSIATYPTIFAALNTADQNNTILHITNSGIGASVTVAISNSTSFAWRYGIKVDAGASFTNSKVDVVWDGVLTHVDTSSGGCANGSWFTGAGLSSYVPVFDSSGGVTKNSSVIAPMFNFGANPSQNCGSPALHNIGVTGPVVGSFAYSIGQNINIQDVTTPIGAINDGVDYYFAHVTTNPGGLLVSVQNSSVSGVSGSTKHHGIVTDVAPANLVVQGTSFIYLNEAITGVAGNNLTLISGNTSLVTQGSKSIVMTGTGGVIHKDNYWDKPPVSAIVTPGDCGGAGETVIGAFAGLLQIGATNPTTTCKIRLPWIPYGAGLGLCNPVLNGGGISLSAVPSGTRDWTFSSGAVDIHGGQIFFNCPGQN